LPTVPGAIGVQQHKNVVKVMSKVHVNANSLK